MIIADEITGTSASMFVIAGLCKAIGLVDSINMATNWEEGDSMSVMLLARKLKLQEASHEIVEGRGILDIALNYGFDTHAGFTKAFIAVFGCGSR